MKKTLKIITNLLVIIILLLPLSAAGETELQLTSCSLSTAKFDPTTGTVKINFSTNDSCYVYCQIYDSGYNEIATVSNGGDVPSAGNWSLTWKGTNSNGKYVSAGSYIIGLALSDQYGNATDPQQLKVEVFYTANNKAPQISNLTLSASQIVAGTDKVKISFNADSECLLYCKVYDIDNSQVAVVSNGVKLSKASNWYVTWSGTDSNGNKLSSGKYKIAVWLKNSAGTSKTLYTNIEIVKSDSGNNKIVTFKDKTLETIIRLKINKNQGSILLSDVQKITKLEINYKLEGYGVIRDISGIENLTNLTTLNLGKMSNVNKVTSLEPLRNLKKLTELYLDMNQVTSLDPLRGLSNLRVLHVGGNKISSVEPLRNLTDLEVLYLGNNYLNGGNNVSDLSPISGLVNLRELGLESNEKITNIDAIKGMTKLTYLNLRGPHISSISALAGMKNLRYLEVGTGNSKIADISVIKNFTELRTLDLAYNKITTVEPLRNLTKLEYLSIAGNNIRKLEPIKGLVNLKELYLGTGCAGGNPITDFSVLNNFTRLEKLGLCSLKLKNINFVANFSSLKWLDATNNEITSIEPLRGLTYLKYLYVSGNKITDYSPIYDILNNLSDTDININQ